MNLSPQLLPPINSLSQHVKGARSLVHSCLKKTSVYAVPIRSWVLFLVLRLTQLKDKVSALVEVN